MKEKEIKKSSVEIEFAVLGYYSNDIIPVKTVWVELMRNVEIDTCREVTVERLFSFTEEDNITIQTANSLSEKKEIKLWELSNVEELAKVFNVHWSKVFHSYEGVIKIRTKSKLSIKELFGVDYVIVTD